MLTGLQEGMLTGLKGTEVDENLAGPESVSPNFIPISVDTIIPQWVHPIYLDGGSLQPRGGLGGQILRSSHPPKAWSVRANYVCAR
jgi:hypothetical protein